MPLNGLDDSGRAKLRPSRIDPLLVGLLAMARCKVGLELAVLTGLCSFFLSLLDRNGPNTE
jgi:hypothetical protein